MGEAHRVARRHAQAGLEAVARLERGNRDGSHLRPHQGGACLRIRERVREATWHVGCSPWERCWPPPARREGVRTRPHRPAPILRRRDRKSTRLNSSHSQISYAVFCLKKKKKKENKK